MEWLVIADLRGGRNGSDNLLDPEASPNQGVEAYNVEFDEHALLACKRHGATQVVPAVVTGFAIVGGIYTLIRHVPVAGERFAQLWHFSGNMQVKMFDGTTLKDVPVIEGILSNPEDIYGTTLNGKLFLSYTSVRDRLYVYDDTLVPPSVRLVGFGLPLAAPTVANTGAGTYATTPRYYRIRWYHASTAGGGTVTRVSEPSPASAAFTPSGTGLAARITRPSPLGEGETHWGVEVSLDKTLWYVLAAPNNDALSADGIPVATTTYDDAIVTTLYSTYPLSAQLGTYTPWPGVRFLMSDGNRLIGAGSRIAGGPTSRVYYGPVLGSTNLGDDERLNDLVDLNPYTDLNDKDGGAITGLGGPLPGGVIFAFKLRQIWRGTPTGDLEAPYAWRRLSTTVGAINQKSIVLAEDAESRPALYFASLIGPCRLGGFTGLEYLGRDIEDIWMGEDSVGLLRGVRRHDRRVNYDATVSVCHVVWHYEQHQLVWHITRSDLAGTNLNYPNDRLVLDVRQTVKKDRYGVRGGWTNHSIPAAMQPICSAMFSNTVGAGVNSLDLKPYIGTLAASPYKTDDDDAATDAGTPFQGYIKTRCLVPLSQLGHNFGIRETVLLASPTVAPVIITQTIDRDQGAELQVSTVSLQLDTGYTAQTGVIRKFEGGAQSDMGIMQIQLGDSAPSAAHWKLTALLVPTTQERTK